MKKFFKIFLILLFTLVYNCGFQPILTNTVDSFSISIENSSGSKRVNKIIGDTISSFKDSNNIYNIILISTETNNVISRTNKGDPNILEIIVDLNYTIKKNNKILFEKSTSERSTYNNISDKFELKKSKDILVKNLAENLAQDIILTISSINNDS
jgi:outer membrane lipopolysaccharide assembly protein LptE/RlpB